MGLEVYFESHNYLISLFYFKYGDIKIQKLAPPTQITTKDPRDLWVSLSVWGGKSNWFSDGYSCKLRKGSNIDFWRHRFIGAT